VFRLIFLTLGLLTLCLIVWHIGPRNIYEAVARLGPGALLLILLPSILMYALEAYGWRMTLGRYAHIVPFWKLLAIRTAGEVVNMTTPTAYVGGEPLKAYLLKQYGVPMVEGLASVVTAKTTMTIAQIGFILVGMAMGFWLLGTGGSPGKTAMATMVSVGLLAFGVGGFLLIQRRGIFSSLLWAVRKIGLAIKVLDSHEERLLELDRTIAAFYVKNRSGFLMSVLLFFFGWLVETIEVFVMLRVLGEPATVTAAIAIGALSVFIKGGAFFIPGSLGAQDAGNLLLVTTFGYGEVAGIAFALLRRFRELVWVLIGLICLAMTGKAAKEVQG
jgi:uncharacterized protein (TIRG00374 family)